MNILFNRFVFLLLTLAMCTLGALFELIRAINACKKQQKTADADLKRELEEMKRKE